MEQHNVGSEILLIPASEVIDRVRGMYCAMQLGSRVPERLFMPGVFYKGAFLYFDIITLITDFAKKI